MINLNNITETVEKEAGVTFSDNLGNPKSLLVTFFDTGSDIKLKINQIKDCNGIIFVYDVARKETFDSLGMWLQEVEQFSMGGGKEVVKLLVGNKVDQSRSVPRDQAEEWARNRGMLFMEASAKTKEGIAQVFTEVVQKAACDTEWCEWRDVALDSTQSISSRTRAAFFLRTEGSARSVAVLARALQQRNDGALLRHELAYILGQMRNSDACPVLAERLQDETDDLLVRHECAEALGAIGDDRFLELLQKYSRHDRPEIAETCAIAVDLFTWRSTYSESVTNGVRSPENHSYLSVDPAPALTDKSVEELERILLNKRLSLFERYRAMFALRNVNSDVAAAALARGLTDDSALFRHEVAYVLGQMQQLVAVAPLVRVLTDTTEHRMVRHECAESLGSIGGDGATAALQNYQVDDEDVVRESCEVALDAMQYWNTFAAGGDCAEPMQLV